MDPAILRLLAWAARPSRTRCPHCGAAPLIRWGTCSGRQRYRCKACRRTSSDFTGTALAYSKRVGYWVEFARCMEQSMSVRATARTIGVHKDTAWRWRHRVLSQLLLSTALPLVGAVELLEARLLVCRKGERDLRRPAYRRGRPGILLPGFFAAGEGWGCTVGHEAATLLLARDPRGVGRAHLRWDIGQVVPSDIGLLLGPTISGIEALFSARGWFFAHSTFARMVDLPHRRVRGGPEGGSLTELRAQVLRQRAKERDPARIDAAAAESHALAAVRDYARRMRAWLRRFRGVATKYLLRYLGWHRLLDQPPSEGAASRLLMAALAAS